jgi:hypothetical protein
MKPEAGFFAFMIPVMEFLLCRLESRGKDKYKQGR